MMAEALIDGDAWKELANRGIAAQELGDYAAALRAHQRAVELCPDVPTTQNNLGCILQLLGRPAEATQHYMRALKLNPHQVEVVCNLGMLARDAGDYTLALDYYSQALKLDPHHAKARLHRGLTRLTLGDFGGWDDYDGRTTPSLCRMPQHLEWQGQPLSGKSLAVLTEQALGDEIMMASVYPELISNGMKLIVLCSPRLELLFKRSFPGAWFIGASSFEEFQAKGRDCPFDAWSWSGGLLKHRRRKREDFGERESYIVAAKERADRWRGQWEPATLRVGISWAGGVTDDQKRCRSTSLEAWKPIFKTPGVQFVSLQPGNVEPDLKSLGKLGRRIQRPGASPLGDMADYADFVAALDLVITVDNTLAHLSGALGLPTWMLTAKIANWRWGIHAAENPWYPSVRLFRQREQFNWQPVIDSIAVELQRLVMDKAADAAGSLQRAG